ncbi:MAG: hypothetical protein NTY03_04220 [Candidatus Bathyarchaeota archaeon]|nr:hypothetical protein [Candidatus Bathyarchaeota archaeon]
MTVTGQAAATPTLTHDEVSQKASQYRQELIKAWEKFAGNASEDNAQTLHDTRLRVELFLKEVEG